MKDVIGDRMKAYYEEPAKSRLTRRTPVIVRVDGRAFHTFTKGLQKPFDLFMARAMQSTALYLLKNIQGAKFVYTQSDEISLLLIDYETLDQSAFFDYEVQKLTSVIASMATLHFNQIFRRSVEDFKIELFGDETKRAKQSAADKKYVKTLDERVYTGATFDARCFNIPDAEVVNYFLYRQKDAYRNAVSSIGQSVFSQKMLQKKHTDDIIKMLAEYKGINKLTDVYAGSSLYGYDQYKTTDENGKSVYGSYAVTNFNDIRKEMELALLP